MLSRKVFLASAVLSAGRLSMRFLDMIAVLIVARFITPAEFGIVSLAIATLMVLRALTELPVSEALVRTEELRPQDVDTAFTLALLRGLALAALLAAVAWPMAWVYRDDRLAGLILALTIAPLAMALKSPNMVEFSRAVNYTPTTLIDTGTRLVGFAVSVAVAFLTKSYWALIVGLVIPPVLAAPISYLIAPYRPRLSFASTREILSFAGWLTAARFVATANGEIDRFFIGGVLGKSAVGLFAMGRSVATTASWAIGTPLMQAMFPGFAKLQTEPERLRPAYLKGQGVLVATVMPLGLGLAVLAEPTVALVLGPQWQGVAPIIQAFAPVGALATMTMPVQALVLALGKPRPLVVRDLLVMVLGVPVVILGALAFGLMGAVFARMITGVVHTLLNLAIVRRSLGLSIAVQLGNSWRSLVSVAVMVAAMLPVRQLGMGESPPAALALLLLSAAFGGAVYTASHAVLWLISGRPAGPERFLFEQAEAGWRKLGSIRQRKMLA